MSVNCWLEITKVGPGETAQVLELMRLSLSEDTKSAPSSRGGLLATSSNSSSRPSDALFWSPQVPM